MVTSRSVAVVLATTGLMVAAPAADAQPALSNQPPTSVDTASGTATTAQTTQPAQPTASGETTATLPRTGMDAALELVLAASLLGGGAVVRLGTATLRD